MKPAVGIICAALVFTKFSPARLASAVFAAISVLCLLPVFSLAEAPRQDLRVENDAIALVFDGTTGLPKALHNKLTGESFTLAGELFELATARGGFRASAMALQKAEPHGAGLVMEFAAGNDIVRMESVPFDDAPGIEVRIAFIAGTAARINSVRHGEIVFSPSFKEAEALHDIVFRTSLCVALRSGTGSVMTGAAWPYVNQVCAEDRFSLSYAVGIDVEAGQVFQAEPLFLAASRDTGRMALWEAGGISGRDWGEIFAQQKIACHYLPFLPLPTDGFYSHVNAWTADLPENIDDEAVVKYKKMIDLLAANKIQTLLLAANSLGMAGSYFAYREPDPYFSAVTGPDELRISEQVKSIIDYGGRKGVSVVSWGMPLKPHRVNDRPRDWQTMENSEFAEWYTGITLRMIEMCGGSWWGWDTGWPGLTYAGLKNTMRLVRAIREKYPRICLETYYGLHAQSPWALRDITCRQNYGESNGSEDDRATAWHLQNLGFTPVYKNMGAFSRQGVAGGGLLGVFSRKGSAGGFEYGLVSTLSSSSYLQFYDRVHDLADAENAAIFAKWRAWADRNTQYLRVKRDLFGPPCRPGGVLDGSAHLIDGSGFIFLFNPTTDEGLGRIVLNEMLGAAPAKSYQLTLETGDQSKPLGTMPAGGAFAARLPLRSFLVLGLAPTQEPATGLEAPLLSEADAAGIAAGTGLVLEDAFPEFPNRGDLQLLKEQQDGRFEALGPLQPQTLSEIWNLISTMGPEEMAEFDKRLEEERQEEMEELDALPGDTASDKRPAATPFWQPARSRAYQYMPPDRAPGGWIFRIIITSDSAGPAALLLGTMPAPEHCEASVALNGSELYSGTLEYPTLWRNCELRTGKNILLLRLPRFIRIYARLAGESLRPLKTARVESMSGRNLALAANGAKAWGASIRIEALNDGVISGYTDTSCYVAGQIGQRMTVILPQASIITEVRTLFWDGDDRFFRYKIEVSADGMQWETAVDKTQAGFWHGWQIDRFAPVKAKQVSLLCEGSAHASAPDRRRHDAAVIELEVYGAEGDAQP